MPRKVFWTTYTPSIKANGAINSGGAVAFKAAGTSNDKNTFSDYSLSTTNSNPVTLNSAGKAVVYLSEDGLYDITITDSSGSSVDTHSNFGDNLSNVDASGQWSIVGNFSFETAGSSETFANWTDTDSGSVISRDTTDQSHGAASAKFTSTSGGADFVTSDIFAVEELLDVFLNFDVKASNAATQPKIEIEWFDASQSSISTSTLYHNTAGNTPTSWTRVSGNSASPAGTTAYGKLIVYGNTSSTARTVNFDNIRLWQASSGDNTSLTFIGQFVRPQFTWNTTTQIKLGAGSYHHSGTTEQVVYWSSELTYTFGSGGSNSASTDLGATEYHYFYIDDSAVVTADTAVLTASEFINTTTAPTWSETKAGWYSGSDRCIFAILTNSSSEIVEFWHDGSRFVSYGAAAQDLAETDIDTTWTDVTLSLPGIATQGLVFGAQHDSPEGFFWRKNGSSGGGDPFLYAESVASAYLQSNTTVMYTDTSQVVEVKASASTSAALSLRTVGFFLPRGT